ncbi:MAG: diacylglycerol kinase family protein [Acidimicrobiia bacterium]|nr:diacylglycerol kinase family protein [Acidimicrobiia bacterium]
MEIAVIANPMASQFTGGDHRAVMSALSKVGDVEAIWPASPEETTEAARSAVADGAGIVVAMGGDGMVHHVAQPLIGSDTALGIIPTGTTNVVARLLGIPGRPVRAARFIVGKSRVRSVGALRMTLGRETIETTHHAIFSAGFGLDAVVVAKADEDPFRKYRFGSLHYATTAFSVALGSFPGTAAHIEVTAGDRRADAAAVLLQFRSIYTYFGALRLRLSKARPNPMTALVVEKLRRSRIPQIAFDVFTRRELSGVKGLQVWSDVSQIEVVADPAVAAQADGEGLGMTDRASLRWEEDALRVLGS